MRSFKMVLVRHGFSEANKAYVFSGSQDVDLTPEGVAEIVSLRQAGLYPQTQRHFSSPLKRCLQTFRAAYGEETPLDGTIEAFREVNFGTLEGQRLSPEDSMHLWNSWVSGGTYAESFHTETYEHARQRGGKAVADLALMCARDGIESATVVTHSTIMRAALSWLADLTLEDWYGLRAPNGMGYVLDLALDADTVRLIRATPLDPQAGPEMTVVPGKHLVSQGFVYGSDR